MTFTEKCRLVRIHSALDAELGDSDPMDDITDAEMREQYPGVWAAAQIADMIGPGPWDKYRSPNSGHNTTSQEGIKPTQRNNDVKSFS